MDTVNGHPVSLAGFVDDRPITEDDLIVSISAKRPILCPRFGEDALIGSRSGKGVPAHVAKIRRVVGFTREWTTLALVSFDVDTDEGVKRVSALPDVDGMWIEERRIR